MTQRVTTIPIFVNGTQQNTSGNGSTISYFLDPPLNFGNASVNFKVLNCEVYYTFPNVSAARRNNRIDFFYQSLPHTIIFENGLYNLDSINSIIHDFCVSANLPDDLFQFTANASTSKVSLEFAYPNTNVVIGVNNLDIGPLLGWNVTSVLASNTNRIWEAPNKAALNVVNKVLVHANFVSGSYLNSQGASDVCANVQINVGVGRQILYAPNHPYDVGVFSNNISSVEFYITDENSNRLDTNGEYWSLTGVFTIDKNIIV
jgi:hypothetical protein